jgi:DNA-binding response OmpR family regulator
LRQRFEIIILDLRWPRKSGLDGCRDLRQNGIGVPILMLTAKTQLPDKIVGLKLGADDYLTKTIRGRRTASPHGSTAAPCRPW